MEIKRSRSNFQRAAPRFLRNPFEVRSVMSSSANVIRKLLMCFFAEYSKHSTPSPLVYINIRHFYWGVGARQVHTIVDITLIWEKERTVRIRWWYYDTSVNWNHYIGKRHNRFVCVCDFSVVVCGKGAWRRAALG